MTDSTPVPAPDAADEPKYWPVQYTQICDTTLCPHCGTPTVTGERVFGIKIMMGERSFRVGEGYCRVECADAAIASGVFSMLRGTQPMLSNPGTPQPVLTKRQEPRLTQMVTEDSTNDVSFNEWTRKACPDQPPSPPGWDQWWAKHREHVQETITQARVQMGRQIEYGVLKLLQREGLMEHTVAKKILKQIEKTYQQEIELLP